MKFMPAHSASTKFVRTASAMSRRSAATVAGVRLGRAEAREVERQEVAEHGPGLALLPAVDGDRHDERGDRASTPRAAPRPRPRDRPPRASAGAGGRRSDQPPPMAHTARRRAVARERRRLLASERPQRGPSPTGRARRAPRRPSSSSGGTIGRAAAHAARLAAAHRPRRACRPAARAPRGSMSACTHASDEPAGAALLDDVPRERRFAPRVDAPVEDVVDDGVDPSRRARASGASPARRRQSRRGPPEAAPRERPLEPARHERARAAASARPPAPRAPRRAAGRTRARGPRCSPARRPSPGAARRGRGASSSDAPCVTPPRGVPRRSAPASPPTRRCRPRGPRPAPRRRAPARRSSSTFKSAIESTPAASKRSSGSDRVPRGHDLAVHERDQEVRDLADSASRHGGRTLPSGGASGKSTARGAGQRRAKQVDRVGFDRNHAVECASI